MVYSIPFIRNLSLRTLIYLTFNNHKMYDEAVDVVHTTEVESPPRSESPNPPRFIPGTNASKAEDDFKNATKMSERPRQNKSKQEFNSSDSSTGSEVDIEDNNAIRRIISASSDTVLHASTPDYYDSTKFQDLNVSEEARDLFLHINRYTPQNVELEYRLKPFIPKLIPAVGDIDAMLKVKAPESWDNVENLPNVLNILGLEVLDEPSGTQSEPTLLHMKLRANIRAPCTPGPPVSVAKSNKDIEKWIKDIEGLHASQPAPTLLYNKPVPDMDSLMQEWSGPVERALDEHGFPESSLNCSLSQYISIICNLLDIPIPKPCGHRERLHALHTLFSLYAVIRNV